MKRKLFFSVLLVVLMFFAMSICIADSGKNKGSVNSNKQSLETSTKGQERAEQRHQAKEGGDDSVDEDNDGEKEKKNEKSKKDKDDDDSVAADADEVKTRSKEERR